MRAGRHAEDALVWLGMTTGTRLGGEPQRRALAAMCRPDRWDGQAFHLILETGEIYLILTRPVNIGAVLDAEDG
jgi:hypothetical protein